jgi:hypothetical protein
MIMKKAITLFSFIIFYGSSIAQQLKPGFDAKEYLELLAANFNQSNTVNPKMSDPPPSNYTLIYRDSVRGLMNKWDMWMRNDHVAVISIRGTVSQLPSWLANFYSAMIPASGSIQLDDSTTFHYQFANDQKAMVHVGWTVALGYMAPHIIEKLNEQYNQGVREFIVTGHSQGGAIAFLTRSYLEYEKQKGTIPKDIIIKTYCSAAPKPGNMYYAYDFDYITRNGWGFNVVNAADWVPETPVSIQRETDFNPVNPFINIKPILRKQKFFVRLAGNMLYNKMTGITKRAQRRYTKYLGRVIYKQVRKTLTQLQQPAYSASMNYMRAGTPIILMPDAEYYREFSNSSVNDQGSNPLALFVHHMYWPYYKLTKKIYMNKQ